MAKLEEVNTVTSYKLELSIEELKAVFWALGKIGGDNWTYRSVTNKIVESIIETTNWSYLTLKPDMFSGHLQANRKI